MYSLGLALCSGHHGASGVLGFGLLDVGYIGSFIGYLYGPLHSIMLGCTALCYATIRYTILCNATYTLSMHDARPPSIGYKAIMHATPYRVI